jgi:triosephosphate isomerase
VHTKNQELGMSNAVVAGNWKMNGTVSDALRLVSDMKDELHRIPHVRKILFPPATALTSVANLVYASSIEVGAQNMHHEMSGAFTGEISPAMVKESCSWVLLGHSERRVFFHESDEEIGKKLTAALENQIHPILCIGENVEQRESGKTQQILRNQLSIATSKLKAFDGLTIAYEPVWAIGTGKAATIDIVEETFVNLRSLMQAEWGTPSQSIPLMYGGSVNEANATVFGDSLLVSGLLVGGASLSAQDFLSLTRQFADAKASQNG